MFVKATREFFDDAGRVRSGQVLDLTDYHAQQLIARGLAVDVQGEAAAHGARSPISSAPSCPTGAAPPASSSPPDQAPAIAPPSSPGSAEDLPTPAPEPAIELPPAPAPSGSSQSTAESSSRPLPRLRMPAMRRGGKRKRA